MRGLVKVGLYQTASTIGERRTLRVDGVLDHLERLSFEDAQDVLNFRDRVHRIRQQQGIQPERSPEELLAHIICEDAVDGHPPAQPYRHIPNDRYFLARWVDRVGRAKALGYAVLGREALQRPPQFCVKEFGVAPDATEYVGEAELMALLTGVVAAHAWENGMMDASLKETELVVQIPDPSAVGAAALRKMGFEDDLRRDASVLCAPMSTVAHNFELLTPQIA